jgi:type II secretory pathway component GspD/PulD (secretin)
MKYVLIISIIIGIGAGYLLVKKFQQIGKPVETEQKAEPVASPDVAFVGEDKSPREEIPESAPLETPDLALSILAVPLKYTTAAEVLLKLQAQPPQSVEIVASDSGDSLILRGTDMQRLTAISELIRKMDQASAIIGIKCIIVRQAKSNRSKTGLFGLLEDMAAGENANWNDLLAGITYDLATGVATFGGALAARQVLDILVASVDVDSRFRVLARPNITVVSGRKALFSSGREVPVPVTVRDSSGSETSIEYKRAEFRFEVEPTLISDGVVRIKLAQSNSDVLSNVQISGDTVPVLSAQSLESIVDLRENQLLYLGGIEVETDGDENRGVPYVRKIPVLGFVFGQSDKQVERSELSVLLSVNIYRNGDHPTQPVQTATKATPEPKIYRSDSGSNPVAPTISKPQRKKVKSLGNPAK